MENHNDLLVHISQLYYQQGLSQNEIAKIIGISRPTVSRLLVEAKENGVVEIIVHDPIRKNSDLSIELRQRFNLREVIIVSGTFKPDIALRRCAKAATQFVSSIMENNFSIGFSWGRAITAFCDELKPKEYYNITVAQMAGCLGTGNPQLDGMQLAMEAAKKFNGSYTNIVSPVYVDHMLVQSALLASPQIKKAIAIASNVDIAITGIGTLSDSNSSLLLADCSTEEERNSIIKQGAVGHILARFFDINGNEVFFPNHYPITAPLSAMKTPKWSIGIVSHASKAKATLAAIRGGFINCLIADDPLALALLDLSKTLE